MKTFYASEDGNCGTLWQVELLHESSTSHSMSSYHPHHTQVLSFFLSSSFLVEITVAGSREWKRRWMRWLRACPTRCDASPSRAVLEHAAVPANLKSWSISSASVLECASCVEACGACRGRGAGTSLAGRRPEATSLAPSPYTPCCRPWQGADGMLLCRGICSCGGICSWIPWYFRAKALRHGYSFAMHLAHDSPMPGIA